MLDLNDWQNKKYQTRDGRPVRLLCVNRKYENCPTASIVGLVEDDRYEEILSWGKDGMWGSAGGSNYDIINAKTKHEGWVNVYPGGLTSNTYGSKVEADEFTEIDRIACCRIEWEE